MLAAANWRAKAKPDPSMGHSHQNLLGAVLEFQEMLPTLPEGLCTCGTGTRASHSGAE